LAELSERYAQNALVCLIQDLNTFYVYWDFTVMRERTVNEFIAKLRPDLQLVIRLCHYDYHSGARTPLKQVKLQCLDHGNYYFHDLQPYAVYCVELGAIKLDGGYICFYQTEPIDLYAKTTDDSELNLMRKLAESTDRLPQRERKRQVAGSPSSSDSYNCCCGLETRGNRK
jgi:hypothetical protein